MSVHNRTQRRDRVAINAQNASFRAEQTGVAAGSRILTKRGEVLIENLKCGEEVLTAHGNFSHVRSIQVTASQNTSQTALPTAPIRVRKDAFGPMRPQQDIILGAGQIVHTESGPALAASLLNGRTVIQDWENCPPLVLVVLDTAEPMLIDGMSVSATN